MRKQFVLAVLVSAVALASARAEAADRITPPAVPGNLQVGDNAKAFLMGDAYGTQNYVCLPSSTSPTGFAWTLFGPQATLFNDDDEQIITHFLSPNPVESETPRASWRHSRDSSTVWAVMTQSSSDPNFVQQGAIPWFLLNVVGAQYGPDSGAKLTPTKYIQRVNTSGGIAPAAGCEQTADVGRKALVPYRATYIFYKDVQP